MRERLLAVVALAAGSVAMSAEIGGDAVAEKAGKDVCVSVEIGRYGGSYLDCLNDQLARLVGRQADSQESLKAVVAGAVPQSPTRMGLYNQTATRQRLAGSFGHSPIPFRPELIYANPLIPPPGGK